MSNANTVTQDFLLFSQPMIHEGALLSSTDSGRRLYVHHLSEVPIGEDFTTRVGNHLHRVDKRTVQLAGSITLDVGPGDAGAPLVPSVQMMAAIPSGTFTGPVATRDQKALELPNPHPHPHPHPNPNPNPNPKPDPTTCLVHQVLELLSSGKSANAAEDFATVTLYNPNPITLTLTLTSPSPSP